MELRWKMTYSQQVIVATVWLLIGLIPCDSRVGTRTLRWLQGDPGANEEGIPNPVESNEALPPMTPTEPSDLIPKVDGLTFLDDQDDSPSVLRFYSAWDASPLTTRYTEVHSSDDSEGPALGSLVEGVAVASPERVTVQRIVAGVSFVGGLAASLSICLVCCRVRRGRNPGCLGLLFRRRVDDVTVDDDVTAKPETTGDVIKEAS